MTNTQSYIALSVVDVPIKNQRFCSLKFTVHTSSMVHGFERYLDTILYNQTTLSKYVLHILQLLATSTSQSLFIKTLNVSVFYYTF